MVFLALVLVPVTRQPNYQRLAPSLIHLTGVRFRWVGWVCLLLLILSGTFTLAYRGFGWTDVREGELWQGRFGQVLAIKLIVVVLILVLSSFHDFIVGPQATAVGWVVPGSPKALQLRRLASWLGRLNVVLALAAVAWGVLLVRG
jgi:copper resistance protein D